MRLFLEPWIANEQEQVPQKLTNFDQILTKSDKVLTIYVKNHPIHVENFQDCHFLKIKKNNAPQDHPKLVMISNPYQYKSIKINSNNQNQLKLLKNA